MSNCDHTGSAAPGPHKRKMRTDSLSRPTAKVTETVSGST